MKALTITGAIAFIIAITIFLFQSHIEGIVEDSMMDATGDVVKESPIDETSKQGINSALWLFGFAGTIAFIGGLLAIFKKFF